MIDRAKTTTALSPRAVCGGACACCSHHGSPTAPVYRAGLVDTDGTPYPRLCGSCFDEIEAEQADVPAELRAAAAVARDLLGDDLDGWQSTLEDFGIH